MLSAGIKTMSSNLEKILMKTSIMKVFIYTFSDNKNKEPSGGIIA
jgi:hypothetical protein|tara:strand:+ start:69 stop:203 length:135 start_codon:yes stop_codon:yes gene_type:complete